MHQLDDFIHDLALSADGSSLVLFKERIIRDKSTRKRFISKLNIPLYYQLQKVSFTDTLQQMADKVNLYTFSKEVKSGKI